MNAFSEGKSGGDVAFIEIFKRMPQMSLTIVTSLLGQKLCLESGLNAEFLITTEETTFRNIYLTYFKRIVFSFKFLLTRHNFDVVYSSSDSLPDILPAFIFKIFNLKIRWVVKKYHTISRTHFVSYIFQKISLFLISKMSDLVIQNGKFGFDHLKVEKIMPSLRKYDAVFMSRLHESKGVFDLIKIWQKIVRKNPKYSLAIIGHGTDKTMEKVKLLIRQKNLSQNIKILGFLNEKEAFAYVKSARLFIFPSHEEAFGIVLGEVMLCKTPIIIYSLPAINWCKNYVFKVPCFEKDYFAKLVCGLLRDDEKRKKYMDDAYEFAKKFTWEKAAENEKELIGGVLSLR
jgi:glycosyltransferase involved in cell wall biosynthesis